MPCHSLRGVISTVRRNLGSATYGSETPCTVVSQVRRSPDTIALILRSLVLHAILVTSLGVSHQRACSTPPVSNLSRSFCLPHRHISNQKQPKRPLGANTRSLQRSKHLRSSPLNATRTKQTLRPSTLASRPHQGKPTKSPSRIPCRAPTGTPPTGVHLGPTLQPERIPRELSLRPRHHRMPNLTTRAKRASCAKVLSPSCKRSSDSPRRGRYPPSGRRQHCAH